MQLPLCRLQQRLPQLLRDTTHLSFLKGGPAVKNNTKGQKVNLPQPNVGGENHPSEYEVKKLGFAHDVGEFYKSNHMQIGI